MIWSFVINDIIFVPYEAHKLRQIFSKLTTKVITVVIHFQFRR